MSDIANINIDDPEAVMGYIWDSAPADAEYQPAEAGIYGSVSTIVTADGMRVSVGFDPNEDGLLWGMDADTFGDGHQFDPLYFGGWAPGDRETAESEIAGIITTINGGTVADWQPPPDEAAEIAAIHQRNTASLDAALQARNQGAGEVTA